MSRLRSVSSSPAHEETFSSCFVAVIGSSANITTPSFSSAEVLCNCFLWLTVQHRETLLQCIDRLLLRCSEAAVVYKGELITPFTKDSEIEKRKGSDVSVGLLSWNQFTELLHHITMVLPYLQSEGCSSEDFKLCLIGC